MGMSPACEDEAASGHPFEEGPPATSTSMDSLTPAHILLLVTSGCLLLSSLTPPLWFLSPPLSVDQRSAGPDVEALSGRMRAFLGGSAQRVYSKADASGSVPVLQGLRGGPWGPVRVVAPDARGTQEEASIVQLQQLSQHRGDSETGPQGVGAEGWGRSGRERGPLVVVPETLRSVVERQRQRIAELTAQVGELRQAAEAERFGVSVANRVAREYTPGVVKDGDPATWRQRTFTRHALFGFMAFSAYRLSPTEVTVLGLTPLALRGRHTGQGCAWQWEDGERVEGMLQVVNDKDHHHYLYEMAQLRCHLPTPDNSSAYAPVRTPGGALQSHTGGFLELRLNKETFYPYAEAQGYKVHPHDAVGPFEREVVFCSPPMFGEQRAQSTLQWVQYHRHAAGYQHFVLYDAGALSAPALAALDPLAAEGLITVTDFKEIVQFNVWAQGQALAQHDCLLRHRETAKWVAFGDLDEYLVAPPPATLPSILARHEGAAYVTHGAYRFSVERCEGEARDVFAASLAQGKFAVELLVQREREPVCDQEGGARDRSLCTNYHGHRKMIQNPRKVLWTFVHRVSEVLGSGVDLPISELHHAHFRLLPLPNRTCVHTAQEGTGEQWVRDTTVADLAARARECAQATSLDNKTKCSQ